MNFFPNDTGFLYLNSVSELHKFVYLVIICDSVADISVIDTNLPSTV
jgi:hypothetical protein